MSQDNVPNVMNYCPLMRTRKCLEFQVREHFADPYLPKNDTVPNWSGSSMFDTQ
jgi:hypothetical protein